MMRASVVDQHNREVEARREHARDVAYAQKMYTAAETKYNAAAKAKLQAEGELRYWDRALTNLGVPDERGA